MLTHMLTNPTDGLAAQMLTLAGALPANIKMSLCDFVYVGQRVPTSELITLQMINYVNVNDFFMFPFSQVSQLRLVSRP